MTSNEIKAHKAAIAAARRLEAHLELMRRRAQRAQTRMPNRKRLRPPIFITTPGPTP